MSRAVGRRWRVPHAAAVVAALVIAFTSGRAAAGQASAYVPLDDPAYALIDALIARGQLRALSLLERPYTAAQITAALEQDDGVREASAVVGSWLDAVALAARRYGPRPVSGSAIRGAAPNVGRPRAAPELPDGDAGYVYADALIARGLLRPLAAAPRPYSLAQLRAAVAVEPAPSDSVARGWLRELMRAAERADSLARRAAVETVTADDDGPPIVAEFAAALLWTGQTSGRRDLMRPTGGSRGAPGFEARAAAVAGPLTAAVRGAYDRRLRADPEYQGRRERGLVGRFDDAYVAVQGSVGELFVGRLSRNWGPARPQGLLVGNYAYSYDHLYLRLGRPALHASAMLTRLDDIHARDTIYQRHLATHRVALRWRGFEAAIEESLIYGGAGRSAELVYLNPFNVYTAALFNNEAGSGNSLVALDLALRTGSFGTWSAQLMVDDLQIDDCRPGCEEPASYGVTASAEGLPLSGQQRWFLAYERVSNLSYRTPQRWEMYAIRGIAIGGGFSDYDEISGGLDLAIVPAVPLRIYAAHQRQGAGDYRITYPPEPEYAATPGFLAAPVVRVTRLALEASGGASFAQVRADFGYNRTRGGAGAAASHQASRSGFEGRLRVMLQSPVLRFVE